MWQNLIIQLGISAAVLFVGFQIAVLIIKKWAESDKARTGVIEAGFKAITDAHTSQVAVMNSQHTAQIQVMSSHNLLMMQSFNRLVLAVNGLDAKFSAAFDMTPRPIEVATIPPLNKPTPPINRPEPMAKVIVDKDHPVELDEDKTPVEGTQIPVTPTKRPKTEPGASKKSGTYSYGPLKK